MSGVGVVAPLPSEARALSRQRQGPGDLSQLPSGGRVSVCGIGPLRARLAATDLLRRGATALISWGTAGGLEPGMAAGSVVVPERILAQDGRVFWSEAGWRHGVADRLREALLVSLGALVTSAAPLVSLEEKQALKERSGAAAVDMESAAVAAVAEAEGVPFLAVRAIADPADCVVPSCALEAVDASGTLRLWRLSTALCREPRAVLDLMRLAYSFRAACRTLALVSLRAGPELLCPA